MMDTKSQVKERPILFSSPMVRAILEGRKTQTRRVIFKDGEPECHMPWWCRDHWQDGDEMLRCPYAGPRLWVRETFDALIDPGATKAETRRKVWNEEEQETEHWVVDYRADGGHGRIMDKNGTRKWKPSIFMPRWASRITLEVTDVRVQRLHEISESDKFAEGATADVPFGTVWRKINTKPGIRWEDNPWVWAITFKRVDTNGGQS